jgi:hypothetical protein
MELVTMQVFRGELKKGEDNEWKTENNPMRLHVPSKGWDLFLERASSMFTKVELIKVQEQKIAFGEKEVKGKKVPTQKHEYVDVDSRQEIIDAINGIFSAKAKLTPEQIQINELKAMVNDLKGKTEPKKAVKKEVAIPTDLNDDIDEMEQLRVNYFELAEKKPHHLWKEDKLKEEIAKLEAKK